MNAFLATFCTFDFGFLGASGNDDISKCCVSAITFFLKKLIYPAKFECLENVSLDKGFMGSFVLCLVPLSCCVQVSRLIFCSSIFMFLLQVRVYQHKRKNEIELELMKQERGVFITERLLPFPSICK